MKKTLTFLLIIILYVIFASFYGIINDHITYSISSEYYTRFKFLQFGLTEEGIEVQNPRLMVTVTGIIATWWMGLIIGIVMGLVNLIQKSWQNMLKVSLIAILINIFTVTLFGCLGYLYAVLFLPIQWEDYLTFWGVPYETVDIANFIRVEAIHNFSYIGALIGLIIAILYTIRQKKRI